MRHVLRIALLLVFIFPILGEASDTRGPATAKPGYDIRFPRDAGSHPAFGGEWWYVSGWLETPEGQPLGFQITFFRFRKTENTTQADAEVPQQLLVGHAALSDPGLQVALHDERSAGVTTGKAEALEHKMNIWIGDWSLRQEDRVYVASFPARGFALDLRFRVTQPPMLNGADGFSRKSPDSSIASHYYSVPHLRVSGAVMREDRSEHVTGTAWLDHEWFTAPAWSMTPRWDWIGINLKGGAALMASRIRDEHGQPIWAFGTYRDPSGVVTKFEPEDITFTPLRTWRSPRTGAVYPVEWTVRAGDAEYVIKPLMDDQEFDATESVRTIYWDGAVRAWQGSEMVGRGYLELTGYAAPPQRE